MLKPLTELHFGEQGTIKEIQGGCAMFKRLQALGLVPGKEITKVSAMLLRGPVVIRIDGSEVVLGYGMAKRILVEAKGFKELAAELATPKILGLAEVVLAVKDTEKAAQFFEELLGIKFLENFELATEKIKVKSAQVGQTAFQVMESTAPDSVVAKFLDKHGEGFHHIAFLVNDLSLWIKKLQEKGIKLVPAEPVVSERGRYIFIHPSDALGVLIELIEPNK
ncbi:MAG: FeoA domain-containing protein [candidate division WOR-3 bacterium]